MKWISSASVALIMVSAYLVPLYTGQPFYRVAFIGLAVQVGVLIAVGWIYD